MPSIRFNRNRVRLKRILGIRARLALLAVILVAPLMFERARSLESARSRQIALASEEFSTLVKHSADTQREVIMSVETLLKSSAYIRASAAGIGRSCDMLRASLPLNLPWIRNIMIAGQDGRVQCSTDNNDVGLDVSSRSYFRKAQETRNFVFSDFMLARPEQKPIIMAAYPVSAITGEPSAVMLAAVNLAWMSKIMSNLDGRPGISAVLVDRAGTVLAAPSDQANLVGRSLDSVPLLSAIAETAMSSDHNEGSMSFAAADGSRRGITFTRIADTGSRLIVSIDETRVTAAIDQDIRTAYLQAGFVCLFVLLGALIAAEQLIVKPINLLAATAKRFGLGDWSARATTARLPAEFMPLAKAFNAMAAKLAQRERELVEANDQLTVIASIDMLSGLANRRGFQSRLDFEWIRAQQHGGELSLLMIDVDHFKLFNDTYGHPEGDVCLRQIGETLSEIAASSMGFAGRYGGEEFCLLVPNAGGERALEIGEIVRMAVLDLALPHMTSGHQCVTVSVGVACARPNPSLAPVDLIEAADAALYAAKHRGRNAVVAHGFIQIVEDGTDALRAL
ncbi:diguanylate cyclase domain-containing protein [Bradyrhizobium sp. HKCCYLS1011]|uniref:diguanylate cyclase domain-containing protein n=1 Tax=Bradyrhizobium sp. HKCCYLS1011 TaxID=3420733 RepID=UPI003EB6CB54